jgi:hypothetical protein
MKQASDKVFDTAHRIFQQEPSERQSWYYFIACYSMFVEFASPKLMAKMGMHGDSPKEAYDYLLSVDDTYSVLTALKAPVSKGSEKELNTDYKIAALMMSALQEDAPAYPVDLVLGLTTGVLNSSPDSEELVNNRLNKALLKSIKVAQDHYNEFGHEFPVAREVIPKKSFFSNFNWKS